MHQENPEKQPGSDPPKPALSLWHMTRTAVAGVLMGIANLIPGVSGGTMILVMGLYEEFIDSIANVTALRLSVRRIVFLAIIGAFAGASIVGLAGVILHLLFQYTVAMFALFIGLTLGGAPLLAASLRPARADVAVATLAGLGLMIGIAFLRGDGGGLGHSTAIDFVSGVVGATTMVLPGISGSYMLLVMGQYERIVGAVRDLKQCLSPFDATLLKQTLWIVVPVGIGAIVGIVALSNLLKLLLRRFHRATVGVLLGILLGSAIMMWPFTQGVGGKALERQSVEDLHAYATLWQIEGAASIDDHEQLVAHIETNWTKRTPPPITTSKGVLAVVMLLLGAGATFGLSRLGAKPTVGGGADSATD